MGLGAFASLFFACLFPPGVIGASYLLARLIFTSISKSYQKKVGRVMDEIIKEIESK